MRRQADKALDKAIERLYYTHGAGVVLNILNIPKIYAAARTAHAAGRDLESAVVAAIATYREPGVQS